MKKRDLRNNKYKKIKEKKKGNYMLLGVILGTAVGAVVGIFNVHNLVFIPIGLLIGFGIGISIGKEEG
ncbi:MAG: hypothetical protein K2N51_19985 [Lachnospiraceae bacterium]|nr:hypothetical protein [Lachnospiraceae bacterium]